MKVSSVALHRPVKVDGEYTSELKPSPSKGIHVNMDKRYVQIGRTIIPFEFGVTFEEAEPGEECPDCKLHFVNAQALGGHRYQKHGKTGKDA